MRQDRENKSKKTVFVLSIVIAILVLVMAYFFVVQPQLERKQDDLRVEGVDYAINSILASVQSQGYVEIPVGNQSLILVPYVPEEQTGAQ